MPFTLSHPAVVVPLSRRKLVFSALLIGSMAPDFEYFVPWQMADRFGHSFAGIFLFSIPAAFAVYLAFHLILKQPLFTLLPSSHQARLILPVKNFSFGPLSRFIWTLVSLVVGVFSHILWDAFTHQEGRGAWMFPILKQISIQIGQSNIPLYAILQYFCSVLGILLLVYWYVRWYQKSQPRMDLVKDRLPWWLQTFILLFFTGSGVLIALFVTFDVFNDPFSFRLLYAYFHDLAITVLAVLLMEGLVYCILWQAVYLTKRLFERLSW